MRPKSLVLLALAIGCGLVAAKGISQQSAVDTVPIYVALENINLGDPISEELVSLQEWPKDKVPVGAIADWKDIEDRRPRAIIFQGEPLLEVKLLGKGQTHDPIRGIPKNMRLKTVSVDARKSVAGLLSPGDRVDVQLYVRRNEREGIEHPFTKIILQNIRVFAVDQAIARSADGTDSRSIAKTVSLVVSPKQANRLATAENMGELSLIPRNPDDDVIVDDWEQNADDLLGRSTASSRDKERGGQEPKDSTLPELVSSAQQAASAVEPPFRMKIIFPSEVSVVDFDAETGEPINTDSQENFSSSSGTVGYSEKDTDASDSDDEFPIELRQK